MLDISVKQMKYAVEIAHCASINQAAQRLYVTQSSLSKSMKELEIVLGYAVFQRGAAGTTVTEEGREFLQTAEKIVYQMELLERQTCLRKEQRASIKISIPRATYITYAFTKFFQRIQNMDEIQINFSETNSKEAVDNILYRGFHFGIIRYPDILEKSSLQMLQQKKLLFRQIWTFDYMLLVSQSSELASRTEIHPSDLKGYTELLHGDVSDAYLPEHEEVSDREVSPLPEAVLKQHELVQIPCPDNRYQYHDILIYHEDYPFTGYGEKFYNILLRTKDDIEKSLNRAKH